MAIDYSNEMLCYVVGVPWISTLNGKGHLRISRVIAPDNETAVRNYLVREAPDHIDDVISFLQQRNATIGEFAIRAPSHDICNYGRYNPQQLAEQNQRIAEDLSLLCNKEYDEVLATVCKVLN